jgi:hypothetical protein
LQDEYFRHNRFLCESSRTGYIKDHKFLVGKKVTPTVTKQTLKLLKVILNQNYFQYDGKFFKSIRGIAMGSPLSGVVAELYLKCFEKI